MMMKLYKSLLNNLNKSPLQALTTYRTIREKKQKFFAGNDLILKRDMRKKNYGRIFLLASTASSICAAANAEDFLSTTRPDVIYGDDNRYDLFELDDRQEKYKKWARSTALITDLSKVSKIKDSSHYLLQTEPYHQAQNLCSDEPFAEQPVGGWCTGFLVDDKTMVTAGHCISDQSDCDDMAIIFDYSYRTGQERLESINKHDLYRCKKIIHRKVSGKRGIDFAIIKLDRQAKGREPLQIRTSGTLKKNSSLTVLGHPSGLPLKVASGAKIRDNSHSEYYITNSDTFGGNSGSPVFGPTGIVEGVLVRGEDDFVHNGECYRAKHCEKDDCRGEDVVKSQFLAKYIY